MEALTSGATITTMIATHARTATGQHWNWTLLATLGFCVVFWVGAFSLVAALL